MHNIISRNQLQEWTHLGDIERNLESRAEELDQLNDYYECLIECDLSNFASCKRICRQILM